MTILFALIIGIVFFGYRLYRIQNEVKRAGSMNNLKLSLPPKFYAEQITMVLFIAIFLFAVNSLSPVYAIIAVFSILLDTILTVIYYSAKSTNDIARGQAV